MGGDVRELVFRLDARTVRPKDVRMYSHWPPRTQSAEISFSSEPLAHAFVYNAAGSIVGNVIDVINTVKL